MTDGSRERKVRGSRVRSSRREKRDRDRATDLAATTRAADGAGAAGRDAGPTAVGRPAAVTDASLLPEERPFVETEAVAAIERRVRRWLTVGRPVHLVGPTGCGKTAVAMHVARERDRPVVFLNGDADLQTADLVGEHAGEERVSVRDKFVHNVHKSKDVVRDRWVDNPLTTAVREGATLVYNEFSRTKPTANNVLLSVFEEGVLELPGQRGADRYVEVHPEFRAILTSNSVEYAGVHEPQDALLDRLVGVYLDFYDAETERAIVAAHVDDAPEELIGEVVTDLRGLREYLDVTVGTRPLIMAAEGLVAAADRSRRTRIEVYADVLSSKVSGRDALVALEEQIETFLDRKGE